jgi:hypothetical protein
LQTLQLFLFLIARIAPQRSQRARCKGHEIIERKTAGDVLGLRIEPPVFMDHQDRR